MLFIRTVLQMLLAMLLLSSATAQTVRFETSVGSFEIELFPDKAPLNVANFLQYVNSGRYDNTVINRAAPNFVLQMGLFSSPALFPPASADEFIDIIAFPSVALEPASDAGLTHTRGMVGLGGLINNRTSSFYITLGDYSFLDPDFSLFGFVQNMETLDRIMQAPQINLDPINSDLYLINIPVQTNGQLIFITSAYLIPEPSSLILCGLATTWSCLRILSRSRTDQLSR